MISESQTDDGALELAIEESDLSRIVQWSDIRDTELMDIYFKQRLGAGFRMVPVVAMSGKDFVSLVSATDGTDLYNRICTEEPGVCKMRNRMPPHGRLIASAIYSPLASSFFWTNSIK